MPSKEPKVPRLGDRGAIRGGRQVVGRVRIAVRFIGETFNTQFNLGYRNSGSLNVEFELDGLRGIDSL
jgi:hypothetical protein